MHIQSNLAKSASENSRISSIRSFAVLRIRNCTISPSAMAHSAHRQPPPFPPEAALVTDSGQHLPGEPRVSLDNRDAVNTFLHREIEAPLFNEIYSWCEILVPKSGDNISSLHRQVVKGRKIITSEDPRLHLVWDKYKIYIKPIPACLLSYRVWETCLSNAGSVREDGQVAETRNPLSQPVTTASTCSSSDPEYGPPVEASNFSEHLRYPSSSSSSEETHDVSMLPTFDRKVALGFLRSYAYLIRHPSDFKIAREVGLLPEGPGETPITWAEWAIFISHFQSIPDSAVSRRYQFGHLRMGRLNWAVRMRFVHGLFPSRRTPTRDMNNDNDGNIENGLQPAATPLITKEAKKKGPKWYYLQPYWSIPILLEGMFNYFLFAFATASLLLSAMQVSLAIPRGAYLGLPTSSTASTDSIGGKEEDSTILGGKYVLGMWRFFWVFANATIYLCGVLCLGMLTMLAYPYLRKVVKVVLRGIWRRRG
ncbi:hypothetical protein V8F33_007537 [Rhypophila sp. PSN 637]